jgi:hypothetical protein
VSMQRRAYLSNVNSTDPEFADQGGDLKRLRLKGLIRTWAKSGTV